MPKSVSQLKNEARREEQRENWSRAIELYREAIRRSEQAGDVSLDLSLYNRVGDLYRRQGNTEQAVRFYQEAVDRYAEQGLHTGAIALCNKILRLAPDRVEVHRSLGRLHAATGLVAEARKSLREYCERLGEAGREAERREGLLELAELTEDRALWLETVDEMAAADQREAAREALVERWEAARASGEAAEGLRSRLEELAPEVLETAGDEAATGAAGPEAPETGDEAAGEPAAETPAGAGEGAEADRPDDAEDLSDLLLELDEAEGEAAAGEGPAAPMEEPDEDDEAAVHVRYAEVLEGSGQVEAAVDQLEGVLEGFLSEERLEPALEIAEKLVEMAPSRVAYQRRRAELLEELGPPARAVEAWMEVARRLGGEGAGPARPVYERVLELDPEHPEARRALEEADGDEVAGDEEEELEELLRELGADPGPRGRGAEESAAEADEEPEEPSGESTPVEPTERDDRDAGPDADEQGYVDLGERIRERLEDERARERAGGSAAEHDFDDMLVGFRAQVEESAGEADPEAHVELGVALRQMGQVDDAIREFQVAARAPEPPLRAFELLGEAFIEQQLYSVAVRVLNRALRLPGRSEHELLGILYQLGVAHQAVGEEREALDCYERIFSVDIDFRDVAERMRSVRSDA